MIRHFSHIFFVEGLTFISHSKILKYPRSCGPTAKVAASATRRCARALSGHHR